MDGVCVCVYLCVCVRMSYVCRLIDSMYVYTYVCVCVCVCALVYHVYKGLFMVCVCTYVLYICMYCILIP